MDELDSIALSLSLLMYTIALLLTSCQLESDMNKNKNIEKRRRRRAAKRRWRIRPLLAKRAHEGTMNILMTKSPSDGFYYKQYLRVTKETFEFLLNEVEPLISTRDTKLRRALSAAEKLTATLRYLATGETLTSLAIQFRCGLSTLSGIIALVCNAIYQKLKSSFIKIPSTEQEWKEVAEEFHTKWNFPHCIGAIDGKHVVLQKPFKTGSVFYNYKGTFSIILMAVVDADYKFLYANVGSQGSIGDAGVFQNCKLNYNLQHNNLNIPKPEILEGTNITLPYMLVGDDAFPLREFLMKPIHRRNLNKDEIIFNYRISRAKRVVENAFGILANRFRIYKTAILLKPATVKSVVLATIAIHNMLRVQARSLACEEETIENVNLKELVTLKQLQPVRKSGKLNESAKEIRDDLIKYFMNEGKIPWQDQVTGLQQ